MAGFSILQEATIPRNGSGTYSLAEAAFVPNTVILSSKVNSDLSDIATALTGSVASDGQTTITAAFKGANGSVGIPMYGFASDTDSGMYRIGANNIGLSVGGTKIVDIGAAGVSITGTWAVSGAFSPAAGILNSDGTVSLPAYSFTSDPDSGMYRIGANNLGVAVNAAKVLDISTTGLNVVGTVSSNGSALAPLPQAAGMSNGTIVESNAASAATYAVKTLAGTDPSATDPVVISFRNTTPGTGNYVYATITAALSLVIPSTATMGFTSGVAGRIWFTFHYDAGTIRLGAINCLSGTNIYPLGQFPIASSTTISTGADSAHVFYTGTGVTSKPYLIAGYASYESGLATAGAWVASPTRIQLLGAGVPLPGTIVSSVSNYSGSKTYNSTAVPLDNTIPQITEGTEVYTQAITPTSAANVLEVALQINAAPDSADWITTALFQDSTANALAALPVYQGTNAGALSIKFDYRMLAGTTSATTFRVRAGRPTAANWTSNGSANGALMGGVINSGMSVEEVMA